MTVRQLIEGRSEHHPDSDYWFRQYMGYRGSWQWRSLEEDKQEHWCNFQQFLAQTVPPDGVIEDQNGDCYYRMVDLGDDAEFWSEPERNLLGIIDVSDGQHRERRQPG